MQEVSLDEMGSIVASRIFPRGDQIAIMTEDRITLARKVEIHVISSSGKPLTALRNCTFNPGHGYHKVFFSPNGDRIAFVDPSQASIWSVETGEYLWETDETPVDLSGEPSLLNMELECPQPKVFQCLNHWKLVWVLTGFLMVGF